MRVTQLAFRVGGPVDNFTVQAGQFFRQGQPIAAIDRRDFLIRRDRAEALCRQAEADYRRTANLYEKTTYRPLPMRKLVLITLVLVQISIWP